MKVKVFDGYSNFKWLEIEVNDFIKNEDINVIDIKISQNNDYKTAFILYEEGEAFDG